MSEKTPEITEATDGQEVLSVQPTAPESDETGAPLATLRPPLVPPGHVLKEGRLFPVGVEVLRTPALIDKTEWCGQVRYQCVVCGFDTLIESKAFDHAREVCAVVTIITPED